LKHKVLSFVIVGYAALLAWLMLSPEPVRRAKDFPSGSDLVVHAGAFGAFALLLAAAWRRPDGASTLARALAAGAAATAYGILLEVLQLWAPSRTFNWLDVAADFAGPAAAAVAVWLVWRPRRESP
jgi:VanZ family protein